MIKDHQELLNKFYVADTTAIGEFSADISNDIEKLNEEVDDYAKRFDLKSPNQEGR